MKQRNLLKTETSLIVFQSQHPTTFADIKADLEPTSNLYRQTKIDDDIDDLLVFDTPSNDDVFKTIPVGAD